MTTRILEALAVAAEMTGTELSKAAIKGIEIELQAYPEEAALMAIARCRRELKHRITLADILERLQNSDGRPDADEAWAKALLGFDENETVVLNDEIAEAMGAARVVFQCGDKVGARMAFRSAYERIVQANREAKVPIRWFASLGHDPYNREAVVKQAVDQGLLPMESIKTVLPPPKIEPGGEKILALMGSGKSSDLAQKISNLAKELRQSAGKR